MKEREEGLQDKLAKSLRKENEERPGWPVAPKSNDVPFRSKQTDPFKPSPRFSPDTSSAKKKKKKRACHQRKKDSPRENIYTFLYTRFVSPSLAFDGSSQRSNTNTRDPLLLGNGEVSRRPWSLEDPQLARERSQTAQPPQSRVKPSQADPSQLTGSETKEGNRGRPVTFDFTFSVRERVTDYSEVDYSEEKKFLLKPSEAR